MSNVIKYPSFFSEDLYNEIKNYIDKLIKDKKASFNTNLAWDNELVSTSGLIARYEFEKEDIEMQKKIKKELEGKIPYFISKTVIHLLPPLSYITWHNDPHCKAALSIYLNEEWNSNWGGFLMYEEDENIYAIKPEKNLAVLQKTPLNHCVSTVNIGADYRVSLQFFLTNEKKTML
jgi:Rps23 Pro-64 3,4-dihydroxylase Tpa1-like proline 4-hydroxylase